MNTEHIKILIEKYYEGQTNLTEEKILKAYFASQKVADELRQHAYMFSYFDAESQKQAPETLDKKLKEMFAAQPLYRSRQFIIYASGIAAGLLLLLVFYLSIKNETSQPQPKLTDAQHEEVLLAFNQTRATLAFVSQNLAKGTQPLENFEKLDSGHKTLQQLGKLDNGLNQFSSNMQTFSSQIEHLNQLSKFNIFINN